MIMEQNKMVRKSYAKPLQLLLKGEFVGSQPDLFGGFISRLQVPSEGALPDYVDLRSKNLLPLGPFEGRVKLLIEKGYVVEAL